MLPLTHALPNHFFEAQATTFIISPTVKERWAVMLDLLLEFHRICEKHQLKYTLAYGTLLGAIRHNGFIPWDSDIDVVMLREDYEKFCALPTSEFVSPYVLQTDENTPLAARGHAQLRNSKTTGILRSEMSRGKPFFKFNQGIFLDVFPLDTLPTDTQERERWIKTLARKKKKIRKCRRHLSKSSLLRLFAKIKRRFCSTTKIEKLNAQFDTLLKKYQHDIRSNEVALLVLDPQSDSRKIYPKEGFNTTQVQTFENFDFLIPTHYEDVLTIRYGNWHEYVIGGEVHGGVLFDVHRPYTDYF